MSTERTPIEPSEIRSGDLVRKELVGHPANYQAIEFIANVDGKAPDDGSTYYLLDRQKPAVELPTEPTWGWLTTRESARSLGLWSSDQDCVHSVPLPSVRRVREKATAFIPATAVPTEALQEFRSWWMQANVGDIADTRIGDLLDAIEKAGDA